MTTLLQLPLLLFQAAAHQLQLKLEIWIVSLANPAAQQDLLSQAQCKPVLKQSTHKAAAPAAMGTIFSFTCSFKVPFLHDFDC